MKIKIPVLILFLLFFSSEIFSQKRDKKHIDFKIVGYYLLNAAIKDTAYVDSNYLFLDKITHLNIAFVNPDSAGNFKQDLALDTLIKKAHRKKVKVLASIAGGGPHPYYAILLKDDKRKMFVQNLVSLVKRYNLDGIDVDLEGGDIDDNYENFVSELAASLQPQNKLVTAAIATAYKDQLSDKALKQFDFVNIMSYDHTGPWRPDKPGHHSPYTMATEDFDYWQNIRSLPKEKCLLGVPFYGYGFGAIDSPAISMSYKEIATLYPDSLVSDTVRLPPNVMFYYNNISTIKKKTELAVERGGGVMIWQLLGDATGDKSLLNTIYNVAHQQLEPTAKRKSEAKK